MSRNLTDIFGRVPWGRFVPAYQGNRVLTVYVTILVGVATAMLVRQSNFDLLISPAFAFWLLFSIGAELLWLDTPTENATDSMASTFNVAVLYLLGNTLSLWIIGLSVLFATRYIQKRDWFKTAFGFLFIPKHRCVSTIAIFHRLPEEVRIRFSNRFSNN